MKKLLCLITLLSMGAALFAADFFIDANVGTDFTTLTPSIGFGVNLGRVNILSGVNFSVLYDKREYGSPYEGSNCSWNSFNVGIYAGASPIVFTNEKWELSLPILARFRFGDTGGYDYEDSNYSVSANQLKNGDVLGFDIMAGGRAVYMLSEHWGFYTGFLWNIVSYDQYKNTYYRTTAQSGGTYERTETVVNVFNNGSLQFGVKFKI